MENNNSNFQEDPGQNNLSQRKPKGILILAGLNAVLFGLFSLLLILSILFIFPSSFRENISKILEKELAAESISQKQLKAFLGTQVLVSVIFLISGIGLFLRKEWARKFTVYFSFMFILLAFLSTLGQPGLIKNTFLNLIYPAILIFYFTNKKVQVYFKDRKPV